MLPPNLVYQEVDRITGEVRETCVPKRMFDAGLLFALVPGPDFPTGGTEIRDVDGTSSVYAERVTGGNFLDYRIRREEASRYGLTVVRALEAAVASQLALGGTLCINDPAAKLRAHDKFLSLQHTFLF